MFTLSCLFTFFFFFNDTATTEISTLSLHDDLPIFYLASDACTLNGDVWSVGSGTVARLFMGRATGLFKDRKSTRLNSSHPSISYAVFCLKKKNQSNA